MMRLLFIVIGYIFGLFQTGYFYGKLTHVDLTKEGSGNTGATNALRVMGLKHALVIFFFDALKAFLPVFAARMLFRGQPTEYVMAAYAAVGVILGNDFPFFLKFKGGKGVAATAGWVLAMDWRIFLIGITIFFAIAFATRYVSVASITIAFVTVGLHALFALTGLITIPSPEIIEFFIVIPLISLLLIVRHGGNIKRLLNGTENRFGKKKEEKAEDQKP